MKKISMEQKKKAHDKVPPSKANQSTLNRDEEYLFMKLLHLL